MGYEHGRGVFRHWGASSLYQRTYPDESDTSVLWWEDSIHNRDYWTRETARASVLWCDLGATAKWPNHALFNGAAVGPHTVPGSSSPHLYTGVGGSDTNSYPSRGGPAIDTSDSPYVPRFGGASTYTLAKSLEFELGDCIIGPDVTEVAQGTAANKRLDQWPITFECWFKGGGTTSGNLVALSTSFTNMQAAPVAEPSEDEFYAWGLGLEGGYPIFHWGGWRELKGVTLPAVGEPDWDYKFLGCNQLLESSPVIQNNEWSHLVCTVDGPGGGASTGDHYNIRLYLNGRCVGRYDGYEGSFGSELKAYYGYEQTSDTVLTINARTDHGLPFKPLDTEIGACPQPLRIVAGAWNTDNSGVTQNRMPIAGLLSHIAVYPIALNTGEVWDHYMTMRQGMRLKVEKNTGSFIQGWRERHKLKTWGMPFADETTMRGPNWNNTSNKPTIEMGETEAMKSVHARGLVPSPGFTDVNTPEYPGIPDAGFGDGWAGLYTLTLMEHDTEASSPATGWDMHLSGNLSEDFNHQVTGTKAGSSILVKESNSLHGDVTVTIGSAATADANTTLTSVKAIKPDSSTGMRHNQANVIGYVVAKKGYTLTANGKTMTEDGTPDPQTFTCRVKETGFGDEHIYRFHDDVEVGSDVGYARWGPMALFWTGIQPQHSVMHPDTCPREGEDEALLPMTRLDRLVRGKPPLRRRVGTNCLRRHYHLTRMPLKGQRR